ncbi:MAG: hypothetical protein R3194_13320, partial [Limnobacter sp.]|nr:hypothetical protein [Limnobacter sp.]
LEREVFYETMGALWALSAKNIDAAFPVTLMLDLHKIDLLYGKPTEHLPEELLFSMVQAFKNRGKKRADNSEVLARNAFKLLDDMHLDDFLSFNSGFHDAIDQILENETYWDDECRDAYLALKYYGLNLLETDMQDKARQLDYARLLCDFIEITQQRLNDGQLGISHNNHS